MSYFQIEGLQVNRLRPFEVYEGLPRNSSTFSNASEGAKSLSSTVMAPPTPSPFGQSAFSLHPSRTAECSTEEQQRMLREQSVSSLRGGLPERPDPTTGCVRGVSECYRVKRTLFLNEFPQFVFRPQQ